MANKVVKVHYAELEEIANTSKLVSESLEENIDLFFSYIVGQTEAWDSKFQRAFDRHINSETIPYIKKILSDLNKYSNYLEKTIENYRKIDEYR